MFHVDHGSDFTSAHLEQVIADLKIRAYFSLPGQPRGRGKVERIFGTINQMCLPSLPGYAPRGTPDRAGRARLTLAELDAAIGTFIREIYNLTPHCETEMAPQQRWEAGAFIPRMPDSLEQLDLLLTVAKPRKIHPDGIRFQGLRYLDPVLAAYVRDTVVIRYDPRDMAEIRVFTGGGFLCRAICPELAGTTISLKDITAARNARRRGLARGLRERASVVDRLLAAHEGQQPPGRTPVSGRRRGFPRSLAAQALPDGVALHDTQHRTKRRPGTARRVGRSGQGKRGRQAGQPGTVPGHKAHRRFAEFADAVRRDRYIGLCYGPPGVGKTLSARHYAGWDAVEPYLRAFRLMDSGPAPEQALASRSLVYTPAVANTPRTVDKGVTFYHSRLPPPQAQIAHQEARPDSAEGSPPVIAESHT